MSGNRTILHQDSGGGSVGLQTQRVPLIVWSCLCANRFTLTLSICLPLLSLNVPRSRLCFCHLCHVCGFHLASRYWTAGPANEKSHETAGAGVLDNPSETCWGRCRQAGRGSARIINNRCVPQCVCKSTCTYVPGTLVCLCV